MASMISSDMYFGCDVRNRRRVSPGIASTARSRSARPGLVRKVMPIGVDRLTEQCHFTHAAGNNPLDLAHDVGDRAAPLFAAAIWNDAVGAEEVAAIDDGDER